MSQSTPRKFSEKIAIMQRRQNEDQEMFSKVMSDVRQITSTTNPNTPSPGSQEMMQQNMVQNSLSPNGPPHPLLMGWNRPGGSLPNVHQMVQQQQPPNMDPYANWNYWQAPTPAHGQHARARSPGHYHPYMQRPSKERIPPLENHVMPAMHNIHLQPPDPAWSKARSDPAIHISLGVNPTPIHMNAMNPNFSYGQQWMPESLSNGALPNHQFPQPNHLPTNFLPHSVPHPPQSTSYHPNAQHQQQAQELPVGSLPNMHSPHPFSPHSPASPYAGHSSTGSFSGTLPGTNFMSPQSVGPYQQQLAPSYLTSESMSAPTSPAGQSIDTIQHPQWPQPHSARHFSASPDTNDIQTLPNIILTGADGTLDCFHDLEGLSLEPEFQELLSSNSEQVDPACETQLLSSN